MNELVSGYVRERRRTPDINQDSLNEKVTLKLFDVLFNINKNVTWNQVIHCVVKCVALSVKNPNAELFLTR